MKKSCFTGAAILAIFVAACATPGAQQGGDAVLITADALESIPEDAVLELDLAQGLEYVIDYSTPMDFERVLLVAQGGSVTLDRWLEEYRSLGLDYRASKSQRFVVSGKPVYAPEAQKSNTHHGPGCDDDCDDAPDEGDNESENNNESESDSEAESCSGIIGCIDIL